ncbi:hypothetical protein [Amphritea sp.]|uniref:hypothetical protein n=1 Tax=Amphritea sp. TaxID=1872502 RepID=UPI003D0D9FEB
MFNSLSSHPQFSFPGVNLTSGSQNSAAQKASVASTRDAGSSVPESVPTTATRSSYSLSERFNRDDSFTINLTTKDGDQVEITFNSESRYQADYAQRTGHGREQQRYSIDKHQSSEFGFSVQGDLDVEEIDAIASLIQDISSLADSFFNGDLQTALQQAGDLTLDPTQLAQMDISMQQSIEYRAIEKYREVQAMGEGRANEHLRAIAPFSEQLQNQVSRSEQWVSSATDFTLNLVVDLVQHDVRFSAASQTGQTTMQDNLLRLGELMSARHHGHEHEHDGDGDDHGARASHRSDKTSDMGADTRPADMDSADNVSAAGGAAVDNVPADTDAPVAVSA